MKSPFPGMDPYLEKHWGDIHSSLVIYARDQLQAALPESLFARVEERVFLETDEGVGRSIYPDVRVVELGPKKNGGRCDGNRHRLGGARAGSSSPGVGHGNLSRDH